MKSLAAGPGASSSLIRSCQAALLLAQQAVAITRSTLRDQSALAGRNRIAQLMKFSLMRTVRRWRRSMEEPAGFVHADGVSWANSFLFSRR